MTPAPAHALRAFYHALVEAYGPQHWWPSETAIETVVGAYLTQNTSWRNVERSIVNLKAAGVLTVPGLRALSYDELQVLIRPSGYMVRNAAAIQAFVRLLDERYGGELGKMANAPPDDTRAALLALPGVGPETADAILLYVLAQPVMVVDEYLRRVVTRHGLMRHGLMQGAARYHDVQQLALAAFGADAPGSRLAHFNEFHALIVMVGKTHCGGVPRCEGCPLNQPRFAPPAPAQRGPRPRRVQKALA